MKDHAYGDLVAALNAIRDKYDLRHSELVALLAERIAAMTETSRPAR